MTGHSKGRSVLITGAARRVGAALARSLAADGWKVVAHFHRSEADARALTADIRAAGGVCEVVAADLGNRADIESLIPRAAERHGGIDCLINNASTFHYDDITSVTWESLHDHLNSNLIAPVFLCRDFARQSEGRNDPCIINILDQKIANLNPDFLSYTIGKVGLAGLTTTLAMALAGRARVCGIAPGIALISGKQTQDGFEKAWRAPPLGRSTTPEEIARCARYILTSPSLSGTTIFLDGGESLAGRMRDVAFDPAV